MSSIKLHWLENRSKGGYVTFGVPWKKGEVTKETVFSINDENGNAIAYQEKPIAYYPDGSTKWTSYTIKTDSETVEINKTDKYDGFDGIKTNETENEIIVDNGKFKAVFPKQGSVLMKTPYGDVTLKAVKELRSKDVEIKKSIPYIGEINTVEIEDCGDLKTTVKVTGEHKNIDGSEFLRYIIRFSVFYDENEIKIIHTFLYDGDEKTNFIKGVGVQLTRKMEGELYNRRIKITGDCGVMHETMQLLNLWRPRLGPSIGIQPIYSKQLAGEKVSLSEMVDLRNGNAVTKEEIDNVTKWDSYRLQQVTADSFEVKKRTGHEECTFIKANWGKRSKGLMYIADETKGTAFCMHNFWEKYPTSIYADGLCTDNASLTAWIVPPDAEAQDMRHYDTVAHDQTYYEGFPEIGSSAYGIANTNEMSLFLYDTVPSDDELMKQAETVQKPSVLVATPEYYHEVKAMGEWSLPSKDTPLKKWLEEELDKAFAFYKNEVEQRHWYGLWNYGDIMHTYDAQRHCWRYDMGGYAWQNTELIPTLWLWLAFMRSGREDIFTMAEAMSRHCSEVDIYHFGPLKGLGSRHNVRHWGCSCKEARIAMAGHHRFYYYLTGDMRLGDVFDDVKDSDEAIVTTDPLRFFFDKDKMNAPAHARSGPDWSSFCSDWMTQWERFNDDTYRNKIQIGIDDLKALPLRLTSGPDFEYDPKDSHLRYIGERTNGGSHLQVCMGAIQVWIEIADLLGDEEWKDMLAEHGRFYYLPKEKHLEESNGLIGNREFSLPFMASGLAAYGAARLHDKWLAQTTWKILLHALCTHNNTEGFLAHDIFDAGNKEVLHEIPWITTNFTSQWCLNIITALRYIREDLPKTMEELEKLLAGLDESGFHKA